MKAVLKHIVSRTYKPLLVKYLSKTRIFRYQGIELEIPPEVFHPGFFFSTRLLLRYLLALPIGNKTILELGAGSGLISFQAARKGAVVTATDVNPKAIDYLKRNASKTGIPVNIIASDLFQSIPKQIFDYIIINPPYYKKRPLSWQDYAWYCGEQGEYFEQLFMEMNPYYGTSTIALMILCDGCDIEMVRSIARKNDYELALKQTYQNLLEKNFIFEIKPKSIADNE